MWTTLLLAIVAGFSPTPEDQAPGGLKRTASLGARVGATPEGVAVEAVLPGSSAEAAGLKAGDVLLSLDGAKVEAPGGFVGAIGRLKGGAIARVELRRDGSTQKLEIPLKPRAFETSDAYEVEYGSVESKGGKLRTIVTRPKGPVDPKIKRPAFFLIQGIGTFSVDNPPEGPLGTYKTIVDDFARRGFVTLRVDKPGCGDSEGGPARSVDFDTELDGYRRGLAMLKGRPDVDPANVFVFGHSMGGVMAPLVARDVPVRGIIAYGTIARSLVEYLPENFRRQAELAGAPYAEVDRRARLDSELMTRLFVDGLEPGQVAGRFPALKGRVEQLFPDGRTLGDREVAFFRQLAGKNLGEAWASFDGHALAIWGRADYVSDQDDHALIARIVDREHPGRGTFLALDGADHGFLKAATPEESLARRRSAGEFNPAVLDVCRAWVDRTLARPQG